LLELFILKLIDCALGTLKNVFIIKNKNLLASLTVSFSSFFFYLGVVRLTEVKGYLGISIVSLAVFLGSYITLFTMDKLEKERIFVFNITASSFDEGLSFIETLKENSFKVLSHKGYDKHGNKTLSMKVFSYSKDESTLLYGLMPVGFKYYIEETKTFAERG
jgi:uncharacterized protein YebE (UPF0316 family)